MVTLPSSYAGGELMVGHNCTATPAVPTATSDGGTGAELADLLREHFSTPVPRYYGGPATDPPNPRLPCSSPK